MGAIDEPRGLSTSEKRVREAPIDLGECLLRAESDELSARLQRGRRRVERLGARGALRNSNQRNEPPTSRVMRAVIEEASVQQGIRDAISSEEYLLGALR